MKSQNFLELTQKLKKASTDEEKLKLLKEVVHAKNFDNFSEKEQLVLYSICAIGQEDVLVDPQNVIQMLLPLEKFYSDIGGIVGYHSLCLELLTKKKGLNQKIHTPKAVDLQDPALSKKYAKEGIYHLDHLAEMYPVGGAADRLALKNKETGGFVVAATLEFCEHSLLERLIRDVQAKEYLHYKLFGKQVTVPIILMTSNEKDGDQQIRQILKENHFFGRSEEDFFIFSQPLVPALKKDKNWCLINGKNLLLKPGGHGVIWKLAEEFGALKWARERGKKKVLLRQINNIIAGVDNGLAAFLGVGFEKDYEFGFATVPRIPGAGEGIDVIVESEDGFCLTNIEYCDFEESDVKGSQLANTNILFADLEKVEKLIEKNPIPGKLINIKKVKYEASPHQMVEEEIFRLESTMQNIADCIVEKDKNLKRSFITKNERKKTISTIKKEFAFGSSMLLTPEQAYLDLLKNAHELLTSFCGFTAPPPPDPDAFFHTGPSFIFHYHPALGPFYDVIQTKLQNGKIASGSELIFEIAELSCQNLDLDGSLRIETDCVMGHKQDGVIQFSDRAGKCTLKNVSVRNEGINKEASRQFWKDEIVHKERCVITIAEGGEFYAEDVILRGDLIVEVPKDIKVVASMREGELVLSEEAATCLN